MDKSSTPPGRGGSAVSISASESTFSPGVQRKLANQLNRVRAGAHLVNGASISYAGDELTLDIYEVLCGPADPTLLKWMTFRHGERSLVQGWQPVEGGRESDGSAILLAKGEYEK